MPQQAGGEGSEAPRDAAHMLMLESPSLLEEAQALAQVGSWAIELDSGQLRCSRECARIYGIAQDGAIVEDDYYRLVHEEDRARVRNVVRTALAGDVSSYEMDYRIVRRDGSLRWVVARTRIERRDDGRAVRIFGVVQDVTERKHAVDELRASKERYRRIAAIVEWSHDAIIGYDQAGLITSWNRGATRLFGYVESEVLSQHIEQLIPAHRRELARALRERVELGEALENYATTARRKDGSDVDVSLTLSPIGQEGQPLGYSAVMRDLSSERRAESALRKAEEQLREAQKMEAVGLLAGGIAHDFNNLLSAIVGYAELLLESVPVEDPIRSDVLEIKKAGASAVSLTRQLLALSRRQVLSPRVINLNQIVTNLERMVRRLCGVHIQLAFDLATDLGRVSADPSQIEQVIMNLVLNARDAMVEGGTLTVATVNSELSADHAKLLGLKAGAYVVLAVADTGVGMDAATRARIFEPFFTTKEKGRGTGLGLSTALGIVQQSGGGMDLDSEPGGGTTFRVYLPRTERPVQSAYTIPPAQLGRRSWETVLLVEDEEQVRALARTALRRHGYQVLEADNGESALAICARHVGNIHLLLTDVVMPRMGGRELAERAGVLRPEMKVLFMSGYANDDILPGGVLGDTMALLQKPITPSNLTRKVREVLDAE